MRAIFLNQDIQEKSKVLVDGDQAKHLIKVLRVKLEEEILILNGKGLKAFAKVIDLQKKELTLSVLRVVNEQRKHNIDLALSLPKKEATEEILKKMTEIGVRSFFPLKTRYSQIDWSESERFKKIMMSALIQSNNCYIPILEEKTSLEDLEELSKRYDAIFYFSSSSKSTLEDIELGPLSNILIVIGPEAGLTDNEESFLAKLERSSTIHLPCPIMRAPTAVCTGIGYVLGNIN